MKTPGRTCASGLILVALLAATGGCDGNPTTPSPVVAAPSVPAPTPAALTVTPFHISGVVTNEDGQPQPNAQVVINRINAVRDGKLDRSAPVIWTETRTDAQGRYEMDIEAVRDPFHKPWLSSIVAWGYARVDSGVFPDEDFQYLTSTTSTVVRNFRLNRFVTVAAGASTTVTFLPDDSVCAWSDFQNTLCRYLRVTVPEDGTLTVSATPLHGVTTPVSFVVLEGEDLLIWQGGSGTMNYPVKAGAQILIALNMPPGFSQARSYEITTSLHAGSQ